MSGIALEQLNKFDKSRAGAYQTDIGEARANGLCQTINLLQIL